MQYQFVKQLWNISRKSLIEHKKQDLIINKNKRFGSQDERFDQKNDL